MNQRLIIIDDDPRSVEQLQRAIKSLRLEVTVANDQETAFQILEGHSFRIALVDINLKADPSDLSPNAEVGYATIRHLHIHFPLMSIIAVTAYDQKSEVNTTAIKAGADDFWSKNPNASESLMAKIRGLLAVERGEMESKPVAKSEPAIEAQRSTLLSSASPMIEDVHKRIRKLARTETTILFVGETGTGKGYFAEEIHRLSTRHLKSFQIFNCPQQNKETIASELFGHNKGAFTGANERRIGIAAAAAGGTLFLDEIEALDLECQAVILRFIETKEIKPLGEDKTTIVDLRFIVASNRDLSQMVESGEFRKDLYSRLNGAVVEIPILRDRGAEEIEKLSRHFYRAFRKRNTGVKGYKDVRVKDGLWRELASTDYEWPGNVRELQQVIESTLLEVGGKSARLEDFTGRLKWSAKHKQTLHSDVLESPIGQSLTTREKRIVELVRARGRVARKEVESDLGLGATITWKILQELVRREILRREGSGRGAGYRLAIV